MPGSQRQARFGFSATVLLPTLLTLVLTGGAVALFISLATASIDDRALERQTRIASQVLENRRTGLAHELESVAIWDEALVNASLTPNSDWLDMYVGVWMRDYFGHSHTAVLGPDNEPVYVMIGGHTSNASEYNRIMRFAAAPFVNTVREALQDGAVDTWRADGTPLPATSQFTVLNGRPAVLGVMPIVSDSGTLSDPAGQEYLLVSALPLAEAEAERITRNVLFEDTEFVVRPSSAPDRASLPITDANGGFVAFLEWTQDRPGTLLAQRTAPAIIAGFLVAGVVVFLLITQLQRTRAAYEAERQTAEHRATHDPLTQLPNRAGFDAEMARRLAQRHSPGVGMSVLMLDLDRFKQVNDTLGHPAGDELICRVSERIRDIVGPRTFLARIGGDEFAMILDGHQPDAEYAQILANRIVDSIARPFTIYQYQTFVGASLGIVWSSLDIADAREMVRKADIALYEAKSAGRNRAVIYEERMNEMLQLQHTIEAELRDALRTNAQLTVDFQPLIDQKSRRVIGAEALARWHHPRFGQISPARFIPVAENTGLIEALGEFVLRRACELGATQPGRTIAVNISPAQLRNPHFATTVFDILHTSGMRAEDLELEITESILLDHEHVSAHNLLTFRGAGIHLALDDFGTGYSSLSYLRRYPVDRIKIDRSFVSQLAPGHVNVPITRALVTLAHAMNIHVTAEGVETEEQASILGEMGCNTLQGFLFSPAVSAEKITAIFNAPANQPEKRPRIVSIT